MSVKTDRNDARGIAPAYASGRSLDVCTAAARGALNACRPHGWYACSLHRVITLLGGAARA